MRGGIFLSTEQVEPALRNEFWRAVSRPLFEVVPTEAGGQLRGSVLARPIGRLTIVHARFNSQRQIRGTPTIASSALDHYLLHLVLAGTMHADCEHTGVEARPGDICLFDLTQPYMLHAEACERITLAIPREKIDLAADGRRVHGVLLRSGKPITQLIGSLVESLHRTTGTIGEDDAVAIEEVTTDSIASVIAKGALDTPLEIMPGQELRQHALKFINANLGEPDLGAAALMRQFQVSRAHLYRAFATDGGVASAIRDRRLDRAYRCLIEEERPRSITRLAYEFGFKSSSHFSRAFKNRFGLSPSEVKAHPYQRLSTESGSPTLHSHFSRLATCQAWWRRESRHETASIGAPATWPGRDGIIACDGAC